MGWNYLSIPKRQRLHRWSLGWINDFILHFTWYVITYPCWGKVIRSYHSHTTMAYFPWCESSLSLIQVEKQAKNRFVPHLAELNLSLNIVCWLEEGFSYQSMFIKTKTKNLLSKQIIPRIQRHFQFPVPLLWIPLNFELSGHLLLW